MTAPSPAPPVAPPPLRANRDFRLLWTGAGVALLGGRVSVVAYPLLLIWHGGSTVGAGLVGFAALLPQLLIQLPAGVLVDRWDRRRLMIWCDVVGVVAPGSVGLAVLFGRLWLPHLMAAAFVGGGALIFYRLAERAAVRNVVRPEHLPAALTQNEARGRAAGLAGQPAGTGLYALAAWAPFGVTAVGHVIALVHLLLIRSPFQRERRAVRRPARVEVAESLRWLWRQRFLRAAVLLVAGSNVLFQLVSLALIVIVKHTGSSPAALGVVGAVSGVGGVCGALTGSWWIRRVSPAGIVVGALTVWTVLVCAVAGTSNLFMLGALFGGMTFVGAVLNVAAGVYQVQITPDEMQGRVSSAAVLLSSGANSLGALAAGFLLAWLGSTNTVLGASAGMLALAAAAALSPAIRSTRRSVLLPAGTPPPAGPDRPDTEEI